MNALPAGKWHRIHPALGIRVLHEEQLLPVRERDLGEAWLALSEDEREEREVRFFGDLLTLLAQHRHAVFTAEATLAVDDEVIRATAGLDARSDLRGPLSPELATVLPERNVEGLTITLDDELVLVLHDGWTGVVVAIGGVLNRAELERLATDPQLPASKRHDL